MTGQMGWGGGSCRLPERREDGLDRIFNQFGEWLKSLLIPPIMSQLNSMFEQLNSTVGSAAGLLSQTPDQFQPEVFQMIRTISENVIMPIAGIILTFIACYELIQLVISHNNLANFETWIFFKWVFKTFVAVELITHTFDITLAIFDVAKYVVTQSAGIITGSTDIDASAWANIQSTLEAMDLGALLLLFLQIFIVRFIMLILGVLVTVIVYGRMIEIYLTVSLAPIPFATFGNREQSMVGQNYLRSLFALGFQGFLIMICIGIYAVLIRTAVFSEDIVMSLWGVLAYTFLLVFTLFRTGGIARSVFHAH